MNSENFERIKNALGAKDLEFEVSPEWSSEKLARGELRKRVSKDGYSVSISHCPISGGFAAVQEPKSIGFDIEVKTRLTPEISKRISSKEEFETAAEPSFLFSAKESVFKSLPRDQQPPTISKISIELKRESEDFYTFNANFLSSKLNGSGCILSQGDTLLSFFLLNFGPVASDR